MGSIKAKMILGGLMAAMISLILVAVNIYSVKQGTEAMSNVYQNQVEPSSALQDMDRILKDVRFRMADVSLEQMTVGDAKTQLQEARDSVPRDWAKFKEETRNNAFSKEDIDQIARIDGQLGTLAVFLGKLEGAYSSADKSAVAGMLKDEWPPIQSGLLAPITQLIATQHAAVKTAYEGSLTNGNKLIYLGLGVFAVTVLVMLIAISLISSDIHRGIQALKDTLGKIAHGDLTATVPTKRSDELGEMGESLENTTTHLQHLIEGVKNAADKAANHSATLSQLIEQVIARGAGRRERVMQVAAAMDEISAANSDVASCAGSAGVAVHRNEEYAHQGDANMGKNRAAMEKVIATANNSVNIVSNLSDSIQKIGQITTVIKEIADQTNLLALNAAIEAARAGEQGRGFAVVADEVRKLAERTAASTSEISGVVCAIRAETEATVASMSEVKREVQESANFNNLTGDALKQIVAAANEVTGLVSHIADSTREQSAATENVTRNMAEITALTEENSANLRQVGEAAGDVSQVASELQQLVGQFRVS